MCGPSLLNGHTCRASFDGNGDVSKLLNNSRVGRNTPTKWKKKLKPFISAGKNVALFQKLWNFDFQWISLKKFGKLLYFTIRLLKKIWNWKKWYYTENHEIIPKTKELWFVMEKTMILCQKLWNYCKLKFKNKKSLCLLCRGFL